MILAAFVAAMIVGCADHPAEVPLDGQKVAEGNSKLLYKPSQAGEIFIYEDPGNKLIYRATVRAGDSIELNTKDDEITINGKTVAEKNLNPNKTYKMFFDPRSRGARHRNDI